MICTIDVGNTKVKALLFDESLNVTEQKSWNTPDLFEPERWQVFFDTLYEFNPLFFIAELRISCVSWRAFLALKVHLKYELPNNFNTHREFNPDLLILPPKAPIVSEANIPIQRHFINGLIGTDRMLSAYAAYKIFDKSCIIVSLGTATTIDLITNTGVFLSGAIIPGIDVAYQGLVSRAISLPNISDLKETSSLVTNNTQEALYNGSFMGHAILIEEYANHLIIESKLHGEVDIIITGGRAQSISKHIKHSHKTIEGLVNYGLAIIPNWGNTNNPLIYSKKNLSALAERLNKEDFLKTKNIGV